MKIPWRKSDRGPEQPAETGLAADNRATLPESELETEPVSEAVEDAGRAIPAGKDTAEWVNEITDKIAADAQRTIAELREKIDESAARAKAQIREATYSPSSEETSSPGEERQPAEEGPKSGRKSEDQLS